jgi:hypothetical protein
MGLSCSKEQNYSKKEEKEIYTFRKRQTNVKYVQILPRLQNNNKVCVIFLRVSGILGSVTPFLTHLDSGDCPGFLYTWIHNQKFIFMEKSLEETLKILDNRARRVFVVLLCDDEREKTVVTINVLKFKKPEIIYLLGCKEKDKYGYVKPDENLLMDIPYSIEELNDESNKDFFRKTIEIKFRNE